MLYTLNRGKGLLSQQRSSLPVSLCSTGGHQWEVQRRGTPGGHGNLAALEAAEEADISVRLTSLSGRYLCQADLPDHTGNIRPPLNSGSQGIP